MTQTAVGCMDERIGVHLPLYEFGLLTTTDKEQFENHMIECRPCAEEVASMAPVWTLLRAHPSVLTEPVRDPQKASFLSQISVFSLKPMMAMAAAALLVVAIGIGNRPSPDAWRMAARVELQEQIEGHRGGDGFLAGYQALQAGDVEAAQRSLEAAVQEDAHDYRAAYYLGVCRLKAAEHGALGWRTVDPAGLAAAIASLQRAAVLAETADPVYAAQAHLSLAQAYARSGDKARALDTLQKVDRSGASDPAMVKIRQSAAALRNELPGAKK